MICGVINFRFGFELGWLKVAGSVEGNIIWGGQFLSYLGKELELKIF